MTLGKESSAVEEWALGGRGIQDTLFSQICAGVSFSLKVLAVILQSMPCICVEKSFYLPRLGSRCQDLSRHIGESVDPLALDP